MANEAASVKDRGEVLKIKTNYYNVTKLQMLAYKSLPYYYLVSLNKKHCISGIKINNVNLFCIPFDLNKNISL